MAAVDQGIDVIIMNSGTPAQAAEVGALMYVGQPEYDAGLAAGQRAAKRDGVGSFLVRQPLHLLRRPPQSGAKGFADGLGVDLGNQMIDSGQDPAEIKNRVLAYLSANPETDAILTLGPTSADPTMLGAGRKRYGWRHLLRHLRLGRRNRQRHRSRHDQLGHRPAAVLAGLPACCRLANYDRYGVLPGNNINSGPGFVTADGLDQS